jgi:hypothetical protein
MKMDQNGHHFAWVQVSCSLALLPCGKLHNFPLRSKLQLKIIDSTRLGDERLPVGQRAYHIG